MTPIILPAWPIALAIFLSVCVVCAAFLYWAVLNNKFEESRRKHVDTNHLAENLEAKLKSMDELKAKIDLVLIKNGFGR